MRNEALPIDRGRNPASGSLDLKENHLTGSKAMEQETSHVAQIDRFSSFKHPHWVNGHRNLIKAPADALEPNESGSSGPNPVALSARDTVEGHCCDVAGN